MVKGQCNWQEPGFTLGHDGPSNVGAPYMPGVGSTPNVDGAWQVVLVPLGFTAMPGTILELRFRFESVDGDWNNYRGWALDDVAVLCP